MLLGKMYNLHVLLFHLNKLNYKNDVNLTQFSIHKDSLVVEDRAQKVEYKLRICEARVGSLAFLVLKYHQCHKKILCVSDTSKSVSFFILLYIMCLLLLGILF